MDYYDIISLIIFWKRQKKFDFIAIKEVVEVIEDKSMPDIIKGRLVIAMLREAALFEVDYTPPEGEPEYIDLPDEFPWKSDDLINPLDYFKINLINVSQDILININ